MTIRKPWRVVSGTLAAAVALGGTAAVAQTGNDMPDSIDLDDIVTVDQVTPATITSFFSDKPTVTLDESISSVADDADDTSTVADDSAATPSVETPSVATPSVETPSVETPSVETPSVETPSVETPSVETPSVESPDDSPDSDDSN